MGPFAMIVEPFGLINMKIEFTQEEALDILFNALCTESMAGYFHQYNLELYVDKTEYKVVKGYMETNGIPLQGYESVWVEMLRRGFPIMLDDLQNVYSKKLYLSDVLENMPKVPLWALTQMKEEQDDAETADAILQTVFFGEIIFG